MTEMTQSILKSVHFTILLLKTSQNLHFLGGGEGAVDDQSNETMDSGKPPIIRWHFYLGIAQIAIAPPPALNRVLGGTLFSDQFEQLCQITVLMVISAPKHPGKP